MQAIILAGGYGTRLYPLTLNAPKPMVPVWGRPMVDYLLDKINALGCFTQIFIVTNDKFAHVFDAWKEEKRRDDIIIVNDGTLSNEDRLWSLGDIQFVIDNYEITEDVMILGGDNFFEDDLSEMIRIFQKKWDSIALYDVENLELVKQLSTLTMNAENKILDFIEKPENPTSTLIATLIYCFKKSTLWHIQDVIELGKADRAWDLIASICKVEDIYGYHLRGKWFDIGSMKQLNETEEWLLSRAKSSSTSPAQTSSFG